MIDYILNKGVSQHWNFFPREKYQKIERDVKNLDYKASFQPSTNTYGNRLQAFPCYESYYFDENPYMKSRLEDLLKTKITEFKALARKIVLDEIRVSPQNFGKYGLIHRDTTYQTSIPNAGKAGDVRGQNIADRPMIAGMMYFDQAYNGGTAFFFNQMERVPDIYVSAVPNRLVLYSGGIYHAPCFDYTFKERLTLSIFFKVEGMK